LVYKVGSDFWIEAPYQVGQFRKQLEEFLQNEVYKPLGLEKPDTRNRNIRIRKKLHKGNDQ
jgi:hypothetical protein